MILEARRVDLSAFRESSDLSRCATLTDLRRMGALHAPNSPYEWRTLLYLGVFLSLTAIAMEMPVSKDYFAGRTRQIVRLVAILNLAYFGVEFGVALAIGSVSLFADSIDFLEDTAVNFLILVALGWNPRRRARAGMILAAVLLVPGVATLWTAWKKFNAPAPPSPLALSLAAVGALGVNFSCAIMLARYSQHSGSLTRAAFLSARNDVLANLAMIAAGLVTALTHSGWPDLVVGLGIALMNADSA